MKLSVSRFVESKICDAPVISGISAHTREILEKTSGVFLLRVLALGIAYGFHVTLARIFGPRVAGIYYQALAILAVASILGQLGLGKAMLRYTAASAAEGEWGAIRGLYRNGMSMALVASTAFGMIMYLLAPLLANEVFLEATLQKPLRLMALAVVPLALLNLHAEMLKGLKRIYGSQLVQSVGVPAFSLLGLLFLKNVKGIDRPIIAYVTATLLIALIGNWLWRMSASRFREASGHFRVRKLLRTSIPLYSVGIANLILGWTATVFLGIWWTSADVGIYNAAYRTAMLASIFLVAANTIAAPKFAELYSGGFMTEIQTVFTSTLKLTTVLAGTALLIFIIASKWVMMLFGNDYINGAIVLVILSVGQFINAATGPAGNLLVMTGNETLLAQNTIIVAAMNILLSAVLIPSLGIVGAAAAASVSIASMNLISAYFVRKRLNIRLIFFDLNKANG